MLALVRLLVYLSFYLILHISLDRNGCSVQSQFTEDDIPRYIVNLDLPPVNRWKDVVKNYDPKIVTDLIEEALSSLSELEHSKLLRSLTIKIAGDLDRYITQPYADEMRGISEAWNLDIGNIVFANVFYDMVAYSGSPFKACTSIVTMDQDKHILHGRNLDFSWAKTLAKLTCHVDYQKNGKTLFSSVMYVPQIAPATAFKPGAFSLTLNQRNAGPWWENLVSALEGSSPAFFYFREVMQKADSYASAVSMLKDMRVISSVYYIVGGVNPYEGSVVIGDRWGAKIESMNDTNQHNWYVLETNYDPWKNPPQSDDRRDIAIKLMEALGPSNVNSTTLYKVLSTHPVLNEQTVYTALMSAQNSSIFHTVLRYPRQES